MNLLDLGWKYNPIHKFMYLQDAGLDKWPLTVLYMAIGWAMCSVQRACHNIFHATCPIHGIRHNHAWKTDRYSLIAAVTHQAGPVSFRNRCENQHKMHKISNSTQLSHSSSLFIGCSAVPLCVCAVLLWFWLTWIMLSRGSVRDSAYILSSVLLFLLSVTCPLTGFLCFSFGCLNICFAACI